MENGAECRLREDVHTEDWAPHIRPHLDQLHKDEVLHPLVGVDSGQPPPASPIGLGVRRRSGPGLHRLSECVRKVLIHVQYSPIRVYINHEDGEDIMKPISRPLEANVRSRATIERVPHSHSNTS